jgi:hypothetical protein
VLLVDWIGSNPKIELPQDAKITFFSNKEKHPNRLLAEEKDERGKSIHHALIGSKGGNIAWQKMMSLDGYDEDGKSIRLKKNASLGGKKLAEQKDKRGKSIHHKMMAQKGKDAARRGTQDRFMKETLQKYDSIVVIRCSCGSKDSVRLKGEDEYLQKKYKWYSCPFCTGATKFHQINAALTFTQEERDDINLAKKKIEMHISK